MKKYLKVRFQGQERVLEFEIDELDEKRLAAAALGTKTGQVTIVTRYNGSTPPAWFRTAGRSSRHTVKYTVC